MRRHVAAQAATGRSGVAAIGVAQEYQNVFTATARPGRNGVPWFSFTKADRRVTCFYFYLWDAGPTASTSKLKAGCARKWSATWRGSGSCAQYTSVDGSGHQPLAQRGIHLSSSQRAEELADGARRDGQRVQHGKVLVHQVRKLASLGNAGRGQSRRPSA